MHGYPLIVERSEEDRRLDRYRLGQCLEFGRARTFRQYVDFAHNRPRPDITVPAAFTLSTEPGMVGFPRELAERACTDIRSGTCPVSAGTSCRWRSRTC
jgi:hypothetical protein